MKSNKPIQFGLRSVCTDEFAILEDTQIRDKKIELDHSFSLSLSNDASELAVSIKTNFKSEERPFIILRVSCVFEIKSDDLLVSPKKIQIPRDFMSHLAALTLGTARGVLHSKLEHTPFNMYLLPIVDVSKTFKDDALFDLSQESSK